MTALGLPDELSLWIDAGVLDRQRIILGGGSRSRKILTSPKVLADLPSAVIIEGLAKSS